MKRKTENVIIYSLNSNEIKKALVEYVRDTKTDCGEMGFPSENPKITMKLNKDEQPVTAEISDIYLNKKED